VEPTRRAAAALSGAVDPKSVYRRCGAQYTVEMCQLEARPKLLSIKRRGSELFVRARYHLNRAQICKNLLLLKTKQASVSHHLKDQRVLAMYAVEGSVVSRHIFGSSRNSSTYTDTSLPFFGLVSILQILVDEKYNFPTILDKVETEIGRERLFNKTVSVPWCTK